MVVTRTAAQSPTPQVPSGYLYLADYDLSTGLPALNSARGIGAGDVTWANDFNRNAAYLDILGQYGGGVICVVHGLTLTAGTGLQCNVAAGGALVNGVVQIKTATFAVVTASSTNYIWLKENGTLEVKVDTTTPPTTPAAFLGVAVTDGSGVTSVDKSGVVYARGSMLYRETYDTYQPADTPPATWIGYTETQSGLYLWDGTIYRGINGLFNATMTTGASTTVSATRYCSIAGALDWTATEADGQFKLLRPVLFTALRCYVRLNDLSASETCVLTLRKGGADQSITITINDSETGWKEDVAHSVSCAKNDLISIGAVNGSGGGVSFTHMLLEGIVY